MSLADYINGKPVLKTEHLTLRTLILSDTDALREWTPNKALYKYCGKNHSKAVRSCFENTELRRIWSDVDVCNAASCRVLEKCGFTREGLITEQNLWK